MDADLESQAADYLADNDVWLYGPHAKEILEVLERLEEVDPDDAEAIAEAWRSASKPDREAARKAVRKLIESDEEIARHVQMAREEIGACWPSRPSIPNTSKRSRTGLASARR